MKVTKRPFKLTVLGLFRLETENMTVWENLLFILAVMIFLAAMIILLKLHVLPLLTITGGLKKMGGDYAMG